MIEIDRHVKFILVAIICCLFPYDFGNAAGLFLPYQALSIGSWPEAVAIGDVNNDDKNDVVITTAKPAKSTFFWPMFMPAIIGKSCKNNSFWGAYSIVCCRSSSATFSITISGKTKQSYKLACGVEATFEGWEKTSEGKKTVYWHLTSPTCGTYTGSFPWVMEKGKIYLFRLELENRKLIIYVYSGDACNVVQNAQTTESQSSTNNSVGMETKSLQLVNKIRLDIPPDTFKINDLPVDSFQRVP